MRYIGSSQRCQCINYYILCVENTVYKIIKVAQACDEKGCYREANVLDQFTLKLKEQAEKSKQFKQEAVIVEDLENPEDDAYPTGTPPKGFSRNTNNVSSTDNRSESNAPPPQGSFLIQNDPKSSQMGHTA